MLRISIKTTTVSVLTDPLRQFHFDYSGRIIGHFDSGDHYRVGLDGSVVFKSEKPDSNDHFLDVEERDRLYKSWLIEWRSWPDEQFLILNIDAPSFDANLFFYSIIIKAESRNTEHQIFRKIWNKIPILPPEFYQSIVVNFSLGCSHDECSFCSFYKGKPFRIRTTEELETHLSEISDFFGMGITARRDIFIGEANALAIPQKRFVELLRKFGEWKKIQTDNFPELKIKRTGSFLDGFTGIHKSEEDWMELRENGLTDVALGIESGNKKLLTSVGKPFDLEEISEIINRIKKAGLNLQLIFLLGLGGKANKEDHFRDSVELLHHFNLTSADRIQLSFLNPDLVPDGYPFSDSYMNENELETEYLTWKTLIQKENPVWEVRKYPTQLFVV